EAADQKMDMRLIDKVMYMNMGQMSDDKFVKIDLTDESNPIGEQFSGMADQVDPSQQIEDMGDAVTNFEKKGSPEDIDGAKAQRYDVTIDPSEMSSVPEDTQSMLPDRKSTRLNSSHVSISYAVFCLKKKTSEYTDKTRRHA